MSNMTRILIVEDNLPDFELAEREIRKSLKDFECLRVETREQYIEALKNFTPDIILSDYSLPHFDGMQALELAKQQVSFVPLVIWTGSISEDVAVDCMKAGAANYVLKENIKRLAPAVIHALEERQLFLERKQAEEKLRDSEKRYRILFEEMPIAIFEEDFSGVKRRLDQWKERGILDFEAYFDSHPEAVVECAAAINILHINKAAVRMYNAENEAYLRGTFQRGLDDGELELMKKGLIAIANGRTYVHWQGQDRTISGQPIMISVSCSVVPGYEQDYSRVVVAITDITERKQAEEKFQAIFENSPIGIFQSTPEGHFLSVNSAMAHIYGYNSPEEMIHSITDIPHQIYLAPEERKAFTELLIAQDVVQDFEWKNIQKDGSIFWTSTSARVVRDVSGNILYYEGFLQDITQRKEAEEALYKSQIKYQNLVETSHDLIWSVDAEGRITFLNRAAKEIYGYEPEELIGRSFLELMDPEHSNTDPENFKKNIANVHAFHESESHIRHRDGRKIILSANSIVLRDDAGNVVGITGSSHDITERKQAEQELTKSEKRFRALIENGLDDISLLDGNGQLLWESPAVVRNLGYAENEYLQRNIFELMHPEDLPWTLDLFNKLVQQPGARQSGIFRLRHANGTWRWVEAIVSNLLDEPSVNAIVVNYRDITERKQAEEELRESEHRFQQLAVNIEEVFWITDAQTAEEIYISPAAESVWGRSAEYFMHTPNAFIDSVIPEDHTKVMMALEKQRKGHKTESEYRIRRPDGSLHWIWDRAFPIFDEHGNVKRVAGIAADITARKLDEMALEESRLRYYDLFDSSPISLWEEDYSLVKQRVDHLLENGVTDLKKYLSEHPEEVIEIASLVKVTDVNKASLELLNLEEKDSMLKDLGQLLDASAFVSFEDEIVGLCSPSRKFVRETTQITADGNVLDVVVRGSLAPGSEEDWSKVIISITDITNRKKAEEALRESEERFSSAFEFAPIGKALVSLEGRFIKVNHALSNILGYTEQELLKKTFQEITHPDDLALDLNFVKQLLEGEMTSYQMEKRYFHKDGRIVWSLLSVSLMKANDGQPQYFIAQIQDITERRQADIQLQQKNEDLALINAVNEAVVHGQDLDATMQLLAAELKRTFSTIGSTIYMFDSNKQSIIMQEYAFSSELAHKIERLIGFAIPKIELPIKKGGYFHRAMTSKRSAITSDPQEIQNWIAEFVETKFLPPFAKAAIRRLVPQIYRLLNIKSMIVVPLISEEEVIGFLDVSSSNIFTTSDLKRIEKIGGQLTALIQRQQANEKSRRRAEETAALLQTSMALTNLDINAILDSIGNSAKSLFSADGCRIFLMQPDGVSLKCVLALQDDPGLLTDIRIKLGEGVTGNVALTGQAEIVNDMVHDRRAMHIPGTADDEEEAIMFAPLQERDRTIGVLSIRRAGSDRPFVPEDLELLEAFAALAASAVSNARLFEETQRRLSELEALYENGLAVGQLLKPRNIGERVIETFARYLSWHHVTIRLLRPDSEELELIAFNLPSLSDDQKADMERHFNKMIQKVGQGLSGSVVKRGIPLRTGNVHAHAEYVDTQAGIESGLYMPLKIGGRIIGVISVESELPDAFTEQDERLLATLASQAAVAFENARLYQAAQQEITERKLAQEALWKSETHYRELADSITDVLFELDSELHYTHWNKASEMMVGIAAEDVIGKPIHEMIGEFGEPTKFRQMFERVLQERQARTFETEIVLKGQKRILEINAYPSARGVSVVAKDITERQLYETLIQKRVALIEYSAQHSPDEVMQRVIDEISELTGSHIGFLHFMDTDEMSINSHTWSTETRRDFCELVSESVHNSLDQAGVWAEAIHERRPLIHNDYESLARKKGLPEGHGKVVREIVIPIIRNEKIVAVIGIGNKALEYTESDLHAAERFADYAWDIVERKQMENALAEEHNQLARRVEERTAELSRANSNLARALHVKDEFLANMSHELRTPLNAILGLSESLSEQIAGPLNEKQQKYLSTINESGHHLLSLINDILDLAKIEAGQITLDINKVDVNAVCQASLRMIKQLAQKKNQEVTFEIDKGIGLMWADERRLKQMVVNLLSNAVKFTPEAGKLGLEVHGDRDENRISFTVWDKGIGISNFDIDRLFKPFVQLDSSLAREATGTGLGLALVAQMAKMHGGSVSVESQPGEGSQFTIQLPWEPALAADASIRLRSTGKFRAIDPNATNKPTILLIEDTREVVMMLRDYLEMNGFNIVTAQDGVDGLTQAKLSRPDLILMDIQMPRMDGFETTKRLRMDHQFKQTPIIALTALAMPNDRQRCIDAGMDEYISKPVNLKALSKLIRSILLKKEGSIAQ